MDFSENVSSTPKWEVQDAHFSKQQYSLHCTVAHLNNEYEYLYHLSDDPLHDAKMVAAVVESILDIYNEDSVLTVWETLAIARLFLPCNCKVISSRIYNLAIAWLSPRENLANAMNCN